MSFDMDKQSNDRVKTLMPDWEHPLQFCCTERNEWEINP